MHASSRLLVVITLMRIPLASALTIPDSSVPDTFPSPNNIVPSTTNPAAGITKAASQQQDQPQQHHSHQYDPDEVIRILVCGDSITQGVEGQFTWRYRLWEWFRANSELHASTQPEIPSSSSSIHSTTTTTTSDDNNKPAPRNHYPAIQFVGPYNGTLPAPSQSQSQTNTTTPLPAWGADPTSPQTWGTYHPTVHPSFHPGPGSAQFAVYGRPAWMDVDLIGEQVRAHRPDFVVLHLGFNDIGWWGQGTADLAASLQRLVFLSRLGAAGAAGGSSSPGVAVLVADVSHRVAVAGRGDIPVTTEEYNPVIGEKVGEWSTEESPVEVVRVSEAYDCHVDSCPAGLDGLHPNALGEYQIARAYTQVFHDRFGFGSGPLEVPPANTIPGMSTSYYRESISSAVGVISSSPPLGIFAGVVLLGVVLTMVLRPEVMRLRRLGKVKYHLLPSR